MARMVDDGPFGMAPNGLVAAVARVASGMPPQESLMAMAVEQYVPNGSDRDLRSILDNIPNAVSVKGLDRCYRLVNQAFELHFGLRSGTVGGLRDEAVLPPGMLVEERTSDERVLSTGEPVEREELACQNGEDRVFLSVKFGLRDETGTVCGICTVLTDITERRLRDEERRDRAHWADRIHQAVTQDRLVLHGQPIIDLADNRMTQAELLVRMIDREGSPVLIAPGQFLPPAERFDLVAPIDMWVVARALQLAKRHRVEINLSGRTISAPEQAAEIERLVAVSGAPPRNIIFEITETAVVANLAAVRSFAERLRAAGCSFALDDFGVGFGSFTYLKHLPVDYLKIDIEFVRNLVRDDTDRHVVHAMVAVANGFGIRTIAEGVEDHATLELLRSMGVDFAQGFWTGRPAPIDELWPQNPTDRRPRSP
jgi:PAS domain S-box-containing protein